MKEPFSIYLHIPFCISKCPYCDFNSYAVGQQSHPNKLLKDEDSYTKALIAELRYYASLPEWNNRPVRTIFFGGGTPSLFQPNSIRLILDAIQTLFVLNADAEITLEANPGTVFEDLGRQRLLDLRNIGINRISMGAQSFSEQKLKLLGRLHSATEIKLAANNIVAAGFSNFNLDLIFGVKGETLDSWIYDLESALALSPTHISAYGLTLEPGTPFYQQSKKGIALTADEDLQAQMYIETQSRLAKHGFKQYEISNYSKPKFKCQHNLCYWMRYDYLGLGAGAHGFIAEKNLRPSAKCYGKRWSNLPGPTHYIASVSKLGHSQNRLDNVSKDQAELEFFSLGLRTDNGINLNDYEEQFGPDKLSVHKKTIANLANDNLLEFEAETAKLTQRGFLFADTVFSAFA